MLRALTILVLCQFAGEAAARALGVPIPGPVLGMLILLAALTWRGGPDPELAETGHGLLRHLALLFVPAGVGVMTQFHALAENWLVVLVAIILPTIGGLAATGWLMQRLAAPLAAPMADH